jgi:CBS domain-containing protein
VLRAIVWAATGRMSRATTIASYVGQVLAFGFIALGVVQLFSGQLLSGLWIAFIGWFLNNAAESSRQQAMAQESFAGVRVRDLMLPDPPTAGPDLPVQRFIGEYVVRRGLRALPVVADGRVVGIISISDVRDVPAERWDTLPIGELMTSQNLAIIHPADELARALRLLAERDLNQLLVMDDGALLGLLSRSSIIRYLQLRQELGAADLVGRKR